MRNIGPDHGLEDSELVQGQVVCHEAVGENRNESDVWRKNEQSSVEYGRDPLRSLTTTLTPWGGAGPIGRTAEALREAP